MTPIDGLYLTGADAGRSASPAPSWAERQRQRKSSAPSVLQDHGRCHRSGKASTDSATRSPEKKRALLTAKRPITPSIWELHWTLDEPVQFAPGQFARLRVADRSGGLFDSVGRQTRGDASRQHENGRHRLSVRRTRSGGNRIRDRAPAGELPPASPTTVTAFSLPQERGSRPFSHAERAARSRRRGKRGAPSSVVQSRRTTLPAFPGSAPGNARLPEPRGTRAPAVLRAGDRCPAAIVRSTRQTPISTSAARRQWLPTAGASWKRRVPCTSTRRPTDGGRGIQGLGDLPAP